MLEIGSAKDDHNIPLFRVSDALRLRNGDIVVANAGTSELLFFDENGNFRFSAGRSGSGPGEYRRISWITEYAGDTLAVYDQRLKRVSLLRPDGKYIRSLSLPTTEDGLTPTVVGAFEDGTFLARVPSGSHRDDSSGGVLRDSLVYLWYSSTGALLDTVGRLPNEELNRFTVNRERRTQRLFMLLPFGRKPAYYVGRDVFYFADGAEYRVVAYQPSGIQQHTILVSRPARIVTDADIQLYRKEMLRAAKDDNARRVIERRIAALPFPEMMPAISTIIEDDAGRIWAADFIPPGEHSARQWMVFNAAGIPLAKLTLPSDYSVFEIGDTYILGLSTDSDSGEEKIIVRRLPESLTAGAG